MTALALLKLASRNLSRNRRRSLITLAAISGGLALFIWTITLATGSYRQMIRAGVSTLAGAVVVQGAGYQEEPDQATVVTGAEGVAAAVARRYPEGVVTQRSVLSGLLSSSGGSVGVAVTAIDPEAEDRVSDWRDKLIEGDYLDPGDDRGILIGDALAETLGADLGDKLVLMAQGAGEVSSRLFRVRGIFSTGSAGLDSSLALIPLGAARELLERPGVATQVALHLPDIDEAPAAREALRAALGRSDLEVLTWDEALPEMATMIRRDRETSNLMMGLVGVIAAFGVLNTVLMSVMERIREFGVLLALGMPPRQLFAMVLLEGLLLGALGVAAGLGLGLLASWPLVVHGIDFSGLMGMEQVDAAGVVISVKIKGALDIPRSLSYCAAGLLMTAAASAYPAYRAARLQPVEAMHHV